jgi:opacity protein-like surface antigen
MKQVIVGVVVLAGLAGATAASAQESGRTETKMVVTVIPGGATFFKETKDGTGPSFGSYDLGGSAAVNFNRHIGIEGEFSGKLGVPQTLDGFANPTKTPNMMDYSGNVVFSMNRHSAVVPYVTAGLGGLSTFSNADLGIDQTETFLTSNVGGGVKWYFGKVGLRGDYRFITVQGKDDAPAFFGQEKRFGNRLYGGLLLNLGH